MTDPAGAPADGLPVEDVLAEMYESPRPSRHLEARAIWKAAQQQRLGALPAPGRRGLTVEVVEGLPALAWSCRIENGHYGFHVGPGVDHDERFVFEGVWDGGPGDVDFQRSEHVYGSGARIGKWVVFVPPKHTWEALYVLAASGGATVVSNSLSLALAELGLDTTSPFVHELLAGLRGRNDAATSVGIDRYDPLLARSEDLVLHRIFYDNVVVGQDGGIRLLAGDPTIPSWSGYAEYVDHLAAVTDRLVRNGAGAGRRLPLSPITPISSGYDSTAVAALATRLGYRDAVTVAVTVRERDDSGADVGRLLGMSVACVEHPRGSEVPELAWDVGSADRARLEVFVATAGMGDDVVLSAMESQLRGRIMLSGKGGDALWKRASVMTPGFPIGIPYGKSQGEFRLRAGFAFVPVPVLGARYPYPVRRVTRAAEMAPWTLNAPYDRPIPRRLVEEAGVPRGAFARRKAATNPTILNYRDLVVPAFQAVIGRYRAQLRDSTRRLTVSIGPLEPGPASAA